MNAAFLEPTDRPTKITMYTYSPGTPRPNANTAPVVGTFGGGGGIVRGDVDLPNYQTDYQKQEDLRKEAREQRQSKYVYKFVPSRISKTHTALRLCFNPKVHRAIRVFETGSNTDMPQRDIALLIKALKCCRVQIDVSTALVPKIVQSLHEEAVQSEKRARAELGDADIALSANAISFSAYQSCVTKHSLASKWECDLAVEASRVRSCGIRRAEMQWPTQHARLAASSRRILRDVLSPETLGRTFISLAALSKQVTVEVAEFIEKASRDGDRKLVVQQIKDALVAYAAAAAGFSRCRQ